MVTTSELVTAPAGQPARRPLWKGSDVLLMTLAIIAGFIAGLLALTAAFVAITGIRSRSQLPVSFAVGAIAMQGFVMLGAVWLAGLKRRGYTWAGIGLVRTTSGWVAAAVGLFVVLRVVVVLVAALMAQFGFTSTQAQAIAPEGFSWAGAIGMLVFAGFAVPIAEEIFFRGVLYRWMRDKWGVAVGALVSGIVFGAAHLEPATAVPAMILGIALALIFEKSGSLWPGIIIHILNNATAVVLLYALLASGVQIPGVN
jgi:membrane protease YdiL (CAAX protease family)